MGSYCGYPVFFTVQLLADHLNSSCNWRIMDINLMAVKKDLACSKSFRTQVEAYVFLISPVRSMLSDKIKRRPSRDAYIFIYIAAYSEIEYS